MTYKIGERVGGGVIKKLVGDRSKRHVCKPPALRKFSYGDQWECDCGAVWERSVTSLDERGEACWFERPEVKK
jgi:hypothetical protein